MVPCRAVPGGFQSVLKRLFFDHRLAGSLLVLSALPDPALAGSVVQLAPVTAWNVDWADTACTLRRGFGDAASPEILTIERFGPTASFQLSLTGKDLRSYQQGQKLWLTLLEGERLPIDGAMPGKTNSGNAFLLISSTSLLPVDVETTRKKPDGDDEGDRQTAIVLEREAKVRSIGVAFLGHTVVYQTGSMKGPFAALRKCTDNLIKTWGFDPAQQATLSAPPIPTKNPSRWLLGEDYPATMLVAGKQAVISFRLNVDAAGVPTACEIQRSYSDKQFDQITCAALMRRARFSPARDASGKAVPSYHLNKVRWIM